VKLDDHELARLLEPQSYKDHEALQPRMIKERSTSNEQLEALRTQLAREKEASKNLRLEHEGQTKKLEETITSKDQEIGRLNDCNVKLATENASLNTKIQDQDGNIRDLELQNQQLPSYVARLENDLESERLEVTQLKTTSSDQASEVEHLNHQSQEQVKTIRHLKATNQDLIDQTGQLKSQLDAQVQEAHRLNIDKAKQCSKVKDLDNTIQQQREAIEGLEFVKQKLEDDAKYGRNLARQNTEEIAQSQALLKDQSDEISTLKTQVADLEQEKFKLSRKLQGFMGASRINATNQPTSTSSYDHPSSIPPPITGCCAANPNPNQKPLRPCKFYPNCHKGLHCTYWHPQTPNASWPPQPITGYCSANPDPNNLPEQCPHWMKVNGICKFGLNCRLWHKGRPRNPDAELCGFWFGEPPGCRRGISCPNRHPNDF
jgi:hypothetical protein